MMVGLKKHAEHGLVFWSVTILLVVGGVVLSIELWTNGVEIIDAVVSVSRTLWNGLVYVISLEWL
jgi:hypothetical protein